MLAFVVLASAAALLRVVALRERHMGEDKPANAIASRPVFTAETNPANIKLAPFDLLMDLHARLNIGLRGDAVGTGLAAIESALRAVPVQEALAALLAFLDGGADAPTGLQFKVGAGGNLAGASTLRVWVLDQLGRLDAGAAANYASRIYSRHDSPDEWAVALRNDWRVAAPAGRIDGVRARALELLSDEEWARQPTVGFLEALDLSVATMAWEAVPQLERWLDSAQPTPLRAGAWIALDRLTMEAPADFIPLLARNLTWLRTQPALRAGLLARADLTSEGERSAVESYLQRPDVEAQEGRRFFELVPNVSATISHNLVTSPRPPSAAQAARLDQAALKTVREWRIRPNFARWAADLSVAEARLADAVASAVRGGYLQP